MMTASQRAVEAVCLRYQAVIIEFSHQRLHIAMAGTPPHEMMTELRFITPGVIDVESWPQARLEQYLHRNGDVPEGAERPEETGAGAVERINHLLALALQKRASDVHIEPQEQG